GRRRKIFRDDRWGQRGSYRIRQPVPGLVLAEQRDAQIAAHGQRLTVRAEAHLSLIDLAVARIEDGAILVFKPLALHVSNDGNSEHRRILAVVGASYADRIGIFPGLWEGFGKDAFEDSLVIYYQKPSHRLAVLCLLPQPRSRRVGGVSCNGDRERRDDGQQGRQGTSIFE